MQAVKIVITFLRGQTKRLTGSRHINMSSKAKKEPSMKSHCKEELGASREMSTISEGDEFLDEEDTKTFDAASSSSSVQDAPSSVQDISSSVQDASPSVQDAPSSVQPHPQQQKEKLMPQTFQRGKTTRISLAHSRPPSYAQQIRNKEAFAHTTSHAAQNSPTVSSVGAFAVANNGKTITGRIKNRVPSAVESSSSSSNRFPNWSTLRRCMTVRGSPSRDVDKGDILFEKERHDLQVDTSRMSSNRTTPIFQSIDLLPSIANVIIDSASTMAGDQSIITSSSMATEEVANSAAANRQRVASMAAHNSTAVSVDSDMDNIMGATRMILDENGDMLLVEEPTLLSATSGRWCKSCGNEETHTKERYGPFGILFRMEPLTVEGRVYKGHCLYCHDVFDLRRLLNDPHINLVRRNPNITSPIRSLEANQENSTILADKKGYIQGLCGSMLFRISCGVILLAIIGTSIGVGLAVDKSPQSIQPSSAPISAPTSAPISAPTSSDWKVGLTISKSDVKSFGSNVEISHNGNILAVASPRFDGDRGRLDVFDIDIGGKAIGNPIGNPIVGDLASDQLGIGMALSGDGSVVAVGVPGNNHGMVRMYSIDLDVGLSQMGQDIIGPGLLSEFGYSVSINLDGSRIFIGAPRHHGLNPEEVFGLVQAYDFDGKAWVQVGSDITGKHSDSRFGHSLSTSDFGDLVAVGAPLRNGTAGRSSEDLTPRGIGIYASHDLGWKEVDFLKMASDEAQLGERVSMNPDGRFLVSGGYTRQGDGLPPIGVLCSWAYNSHTKSFFRENRFAFGAYSGKRVWHDIAIGRMMVIASTDNDSLLPPGTVGVFPKTNFNEHSLEILRPVFGDANFFGRGASVAMAADRPRFAVGYDSIQSEGGTPYSEIHIYDN